MEKKYLKNYQTKVTIYNIVTGKSSHAEKGTAAACVKGKMFSLTMNDKAKEYAAKAEKAAKAAKEAAKGR